MGTTFAAIQQHMRNQYRLQDDQPDMMSVVWAYDDGRRQKIVVRRFFAGGREMLEFKSPFARRGAVDPTALLEENARLPLGTIALSGEVLLVVYNALLENLVLPDFDFVLSRVAGIADVLEQRHGTADSF
jgi:hypothetical protein